MQVLKRNVAVIVLAGLVLGGAAAAWAGGSPARPTVLAAAQTGDTATPGSTPAPPLTPEERQAKRAALRDCVEKAGEDAAARRACLAAAGLPKLGDHPHPGGPGRPGFRPGALGALGKAVHGTVIVPGEGGTWQTVTFDRGKVNEATDGAKIVLDRPDGQKVTIALSADTKYHGIADAASIQEGKPALVVSKDGKATHVVQRDPAHARGPDHGNNGDVPVVPND